MAYRGKGRAREKVRSFQVVNERPRYAEARGDYFAGRALGDDNAPCERTGEESREREVRRTDKRLSIYARSRFVFAEDLVLKHSRAQGEVFDGGCISAYTLYCTALTLDHCFVSREIHTRGLYGYFLKFIIVDFFVEFWV